MKFYSKNININRKGFQWPNTIYFVFFSGNHELIITFYYNSQNLQWHSWNGSNLDQPFKILLRQNIWLGNHLLLGLKVMAISFFKQSALYSNKAKATFILHSSHSNSPENTSNSKKSPVSEIVLDWISITCKCVLDQCYKCIWICKVPTITKFIF